jgi:hypothetical protein
MGEGVVKGGGVRVEQFRAVRKSTWHVVVDARAVWGPPWGTIMAGQRPEADRDT